MDYLFNFKEFVADLRENEEKSTIIEKYEERFGGIEDYLEDTLFWQEYLSKFEISEDMLSLLRTPQDLEFDFDWKLLLISIASSFSSSYYLEPTDKGLNILIKVASDDQEITKTIESLWSYQIHRLFEIYIEEQINLHSLKADSEQEANAIDKEREMRLRIFNNKISQLKSYYGGLEDDVDIDLSEFDNKKNKK